MVMKKRNKEELTSFLNSMAAKLSQKGMPCIDLCEERNRHASKAYGPKYSAENWDCVYISMRV